MSNQIVAFIGGEKEHGNYKLSNIVKYDTTYEICTAQSVSQHLEYGELRLSLCQYLRQLVGGEVDGTPLDLVDQYHELEEI